MGEHEPGFGPRAVLARVAEKVPESCHNKVIVVGSLAAAYHLLHRLDSRMGGRPAMTCRKRSTLSRLGLLAHVPMTIDEFRIARFADNAPGDGVCVHFPLGGE